MDMPKRRVKRRITAIRRHKVRLNRPTKLKSTSAKNKNGKDYQRNREPMMNNPINSIYNLTISARATLDLHSLNNEGGEGNQIQTRMVNIVDSGGKLHNVNAISGDMWKHIQAEHLFHLFSEQDGVPLCASCHEFNANRINADTEYVTYIGSKEITDAMAIDALLNRCGMDDLEGNLITAGGRSLPRKSIVEFGWVVGIPEQTTTDSYFHVKYANERSGGKRQEDREATEASGSNLGQA